MLCHSCRQEFVAFEFATKMIIIHKNIQRFIVDIKNSRHVKTCCGITEGFNLHQSTEIEKGGVHLIGSSSISETRFSECGSQTSFVNYIKSG